MGDQVESVPDNSNVPPSAFHLQVLSQCRYVVIAGRDIRGARAKLDAMATTGQFDLDEVLLLTTRIQMSTQGLLGAAACVSKALWGVKNCSGAVKRRARALRLELGVEDRSSLADTTLRNHLEHIDERIDSWWASSDSRSFVDQNTFLGEPDFPGDAGDSFRSYHLHRGKVGFLGKSYDIAGIVADARKLIATLEAQLGPSVGHIEL